MHCDISVLNSIGFILGNWIDRCFSKFETHMDEVRNGRAIKSSNSSTYVSTYFLRVQTRFSVDELYLTNQHHLKTA